MKGLKQFKDDNSNKYPTLSKSKLNKQLGVDFRKLSKEEREPWIKKEQNEIDYKEGCRTNPFYVDDNEMMIRMDRRRRYISLNLSMGGGLTVLRRHWTRWKLPPPEIELCDILKFVSILKEKRSQMKTAVYIDLCQDSKFYVGIATAQYLDKDEDPSDENMAKKRLESHRDNGGGCFPTHFTYIYPVITNLICFYGDHEDENLLTILMSKCVGNNVRGGKWASPCVKQQYPDYTIENLKQKLLSK